MVDPLVSFVIPVRDDAVRLGRCIQSIRDNDYPAGRVEIIVIDNGSIDESLGVARALGARVIRRAAGPVGELRNAGAAQAHGDVLAFVDADHALGTGWIRAAVNVLAEPAVGAAGDLYHTPVNATWVQRTYDGLRVHEDGRGDVEWLGSGNLVVWRSVFESVGGFDAKLATCEDVDLCRRLRAAGYRLVRDSALWSVHFGDPATLRQLFRGELWRGRGNLRVTLRHGSTWRDLPSVIIPLLDVASISAFIGGLFLRGPIGLGAAGLGATVVITFTSLRTLRIVRNTRRRSPVDTAQAFVMSLVYDMARALALVLQPPHHRATVRKGLRHA